MLYLYISIVIILHVMPMGYIPADKPLNKSEIGPFRLDYLLHTLIFLPWMFLPFFSMKPKTPWTLGPGTSALRSFSLLNIHRLLPGSPRFWAAWLFLGIIFAAAAEGIQYWISYRGFNPMDVMFNILGVVIGAALLYGIVQAARIEGIRKNPEEIRNIQPD